MIFVYILYSHSYNRTHVGQTKNLNDRLNYHNSGKVKSTKPYLPLEIEAFIAVRTEEKAKNLEKYFKTCSGIALARKRIISYEVTTTGSNVNRSYEALAK